MYNRLYCLLLMDVSLYHACMHPAPYLKLVFTRRSMHPRAEIPQSACNQPQLIAIDLYCMSIAILIP